MTEARDEGLRRAIGPVGLTASVINAVVGGGIFALPASIALELGPAGPLAFVLGGVLIGLVTASIARVGGRFAKSGGTWAYAEAAFGPLAGYLTGVLFLLTSLLASAGIAAGLVDSLPLGGRVQRGAALVLLYALLVGVNLRGVRAGTGAAAAAASLKFLALLAFVAAGATLVRSDYLVVHAAPTLPHVGRSTILALFALCGMETALGASGEVRDPQRTVPRALVAATVLVVLLYLAIQIVAQGVLGPGLAGWDSPLAQALSRAGPAWRTAMLTAGAISMAGWLVGDLLGTSRMMFAFAGMGVVPKILGRVHERHRVPHWAVVVYAAVACALAIGGTFTSLAVLSSVGTILLYLSCCSASWVLGRGRSPLVPLLAILGLLAVLLSCTEKELLSVGAVLVLATAWYGVARIARPPPEESPPKEHRPQGR